MANTPRKAKDPTEAAMAAIQDALKVRETDLPLSGAPNISASDGLRAPGDDALFKEPALPGELRRPANDDSRPIGQLLQSMQPRAARGTYAVATIGSALWCVGAAALIAYYLPDLRTNFGPALFALSAIFVLPVLLFFVLANMINRSREMRHVARAMTEVAMRLVEPEVVGRESVLTIGQAVRREVAGMSDGIERVLARAVELESMVQNEVSALERAYGDNEIRIHNLLDSLARQRDDLVGQAEQVRDAIAGVHLNLNHEITAISDSVAAKVNQAAQEIATNLAEKGQHITGALERAGDSMMDALGDRGSELLLRLERVGQETTSAIEASTAQSAQLINQAAGEFTSGMIEISSQAAETIIARGDELNTMIKTTGDSLVLDLSLRGDDFADRITQAADSIHASIEGRGKAVIDALDASNIEMQGHTQEMERTLANASAAAAETLHAASAATAETLHSASAAAAESLHSASAAAAETLHSAGTHITGSLKQQASDVELTLLSVATQLTQAFNVDSSPLLEKLDEQSRALSASIERAAFEAIQVAESQSTNFNLALEEVGENVVGKTRIILGNLQNSAQSAISEMMQTNEKLHTESGGLYDRLREANLLLQETLSGAHENMYALEGSLRNHIADLTTALNETIVRATNTTETAHTHLNTFRSDASRILDNLSELSAQFDLHGRVIADAVDAISGRQDSIASIVTALDTTTSEASSMLHESSEHFSELLQGLRKMTVEIKRELDQTRGELQRGVTEWPQEAAESGAQMRQLIVDQIEALAELNRIVARHGGRPDESMPSESRSAGKTFTAPRAPKRTADLAPPPPPLPARYADAPAQAPASHNMPAGRWLSELLHRADEEPANSRNRGNTPAAPRRGGRTQPAAQMRSDERVTRVSIESLDALSSDIASMIDHHAAMDAWERYNRGDRKAFGLHIYTPHGQRTFDDIRARYRNNRDFRETVDRYIAEFDRLLDDVSRDERGGQQMIRTYLTSETGKVYTMLAHAAGRLD
jgi:ABC-type transporter Mla subunit MlaD